MRASVDPHPVQVPVAPPQTEPAGIPSISGVCLSPPDVLSPEVCSGGDDAEDDPGGGGDDDHKLTLLQACAANTMNMFGTGPFITIPFVIAETEPAGPHAMLGYTLAGAICCCDALTWAELGSMMPYSGGSYVYLRECFGSQKAGRLFSFLFLFQFLLSGPLEVSSGFVAMAQYLSYVDGQASWVHHAGLGTAFCAASVCALYNDLKEVGRMLEVLGAVTVLAIVFTVVAGFASIDADNYKAPDDAYADWRRCAFGLCGAARIGVYDFTGYYDANQMGGEVRNPRHVIPRAGITTACAVTLIFLAVYLAVLAAVPWDGPDGFARKVADGDDSANYIMALFGERVGGAPLAYVMCAVVMVTIFGSCFAQLLGYSQIPYTAAREGYFWAWMAHEHPTKRGVADYSLFAVGGVAMLGCWAPLELLISMMVTSLVLCQFFLQGVGLVVYRRLHPEVPRPFRVPWYPLPVLFSCAGFLCIWVTSPSYFLYGDAEEPLVEFSVLIVVVGTALYFTWAYQRQYWPFGDAGAGAAAPAADTAEKRDDVPLSEVGTVWRDEHDRRYSPRPDAAPTGRSLNALVPPPAACAPGLQARGEDTRWAPEPALGRYRSSPVPVWAGGWRGLRCSPPPALQRVGTHAPPASPDGAAPPPGALLRRPLDDVLRAFPALLRRLDVDAARRDWGPAAPPALRDALSQLHAEGVFGPPPTPLGPLLAPLEGVVPPACYP